MEQILWDWLLSRASGKNENARVKTLGWLQKKKQTKKPPYGNKGTIVLQWVMLQSC